MDVYCAEKIASKVRKVSKSHIGSAGCRGMDKQIAVISQKKGKNVLENKKNKVRHQRSFGVSA